MKVTDCADIPDDPANSGAPARMREAGLSSSLRCKTE